MLYTGQPYPYRITGLQMRPHIPAAPGARFNRWEILGFARSQAVVAKGRKLGRYYHYYRARCDCGNERIVSITSLRSGQSTQCWSCSSRGKAHYLDGYRGPRPSDRGVRYAQLYFTSRMFKSGLDLDRLIWEAPNQKSGLYQTRSLSV